MSKSSFLFLSLALAAGPAAWAGGSSSNTQSSSNTSGSSPNLDQVVQNPSNYLGQTLTLNGKVDRVLPSGDFIMKAPSSNQSILVFTVKPSSSTASSGTSGGGNQQAGTSGTKQQKPQFKQNQSVQVTGKLNQLTFTNEYDVLNLKKDSETVNLAQASTPVIVAKASDVKPQS